jgi:very-short-patch-repair endonuclease
MDNYCKPPKATSYELRLRNVLRSRKIPLKTDQVIWYTSCDCFTPDLIIGRSLIIEVDGKVHDKDHRKTLDRIRQRALENMGYTVHRVKNESIRDRPNDIANEINDIYTILSDTESKKKETTITELKKPLEIEPIPKDIQFNLAIWATEFNKKLNDENWSVEFFRESLSHYHPELSKNQCAMEKLILVLHGLNLRKTSDGSHLDFEFSLKFFKKSLNLLNELFPENGSMTVIHLKNIFNESAPGFFKNLIFKGGPNINTGLVSIKDKDSLNFHINSFNKYLSQLEITVEPLDIIQECKATLQKFKEEKKTDHNWLVEWINATN